MAPTNGFVGILRCVRRLVSRLALVALLPLLSLAGCDHVRPFEQVCERRLGPAVIRVTAPATQRLEDFSQSISALTAMGLHPSQSGRVVDGLTQVKLVNRVSVGGNGVVKPFSGRYCTRPEVSVTLAYEPMTVFVAREHPPGSCEFDLTMNHEMKHVRLYERMLDELATALEADLKTLLGERIHYFASAVEGERSLDAMVGERVNATLQAAMQQSRTRHAAIDTPEEYGRLDLMQSKCRG